MESIDNYEQISINNIKKAGEEFYNKIKSNNVDEDNTNIYCLENTQNYNNILKYFLDNNVMMDVDPRIVYTDYSERLKCSRFQLIGFKLEKIINDENQIIKDIAGTITIYKEKDQDVVIKEELYNNILGKWNYKLQCWLVKFGTDQDKLYLCIKPYPLLGHKLYDS